MYRVISAFADREDGLRAYGTGDAYPRPGLTPDSARIAELMERGVIESAPKAEKRPRAGKRVRKNA